MKKNRQKFSSQIEASLLDELKEIAMSEGRQLQVVLEEAIEEYITKKHGMTIRDSVMVHFKASIVKNRRLGELLAK